ncbi:MAG: ABC transporter permease subunit [Alphaproteobacteria bacterium]|nr:ABC transporter permease subunit [Alphaproteobacteria bacterium]
MTTFVAKRLLQIVPLVVLLALVTFLLLQLAPGGPFDAERSFPPEIQRQLEARFQLDQPWYVQFGSYMAGLADGTLPSLKRPGLTVGELIGSSFPVSLLLGSLAMAFALALGITSGIIGALRQNTIWDWSTMSVALVGISVPNFVLGPLLVLCFALGLGWFPPARWDGPATWVLPAITLGLAYAAYIARLTRAGMLEVIRADFVRTARAKGLAEHVVVLRHALRGALAPVVTFLGPATAQIITGTVVIEKVFQVPGLGYYFVQSALDRDYSMVLGVVCFYSVILMVMNLLVDVAYTWLDPRVKLA